MSTLLSRFNNKHFLSLAGNGITSILGLLTFSILYKVLPISDAGKWGIFGTILMIYDSTRNGFLGTATIKFYAGAGKERGGAVLGSVWVLTMGLTSILLFLDSGVYYALSHTSYTYILSPVKWAGVTFLSALPFCVIYWKLQAEENYKELLQLKLLNSSATFLSFVVLAILKKLTLESAFLYNVITNCVTSIVAVTVNLDAVKTIAKRSRASVIELVNYGKYSLASSLSSTLLGSVDTIIITFLLGPAALAIYNIPMKMMQVIEIPLLSFVGTGMSGMAIAFSHKNTHQVTYILKKYAGMLTMAFIPLAVLAFFFADMATYIAVLGRHDYTGTAAANLFRLYMVFSILYPIDRFNGATLDIIHKPQVNFYKVLIMLAVNIAGDFAGIAIFKGLYGVAVSAVVTHVSGIIYGYYRLNKYLPVKVVDIFTTGYKEMLLFIRQEMKIVSK